MPRQFADDRGAEEDAELEASMQEAELRRLQIEYRKAEKERQSYFLESQDIIRRQSAEIGQLEREREELLKNLRLVESKTNENRDKMRCQKLQELASSNDEKQAEIDEEKRLIEELDVKLQEWERQCKEKNKEMGGAMMARHHVKKAQHQNRILENRLDQALKKFNTQLVRNKALREVIDSHRVERTRYDALCERLEKALEELKKEKQNIIEGSTQAYEARDEAQQKMVVLRDKAEKDRQQYESEIKELQRVLDHDRKLKEFMGIKTQERKEDSQQLWWKQKKERTEIERKGDVQSERIMAYDDAFSKIKNIMQEDDIDVVVKKFIENEDTNFALFNFVNDQNNQTEILHEQIQEIRHKIEGFEAEGIRREEERHAIMRELETKLQGIKKESEYVAEKNKLVEKILDQLRAGIQSVFQKINCDRSSIDELLDSADGVTMHNLILYLGVVEQRTNELLAMQAYVGYRAEAASRAKEHRQNRPVEHKYLDSEFVEKPRPLAVTAGLESRPTRSEFTTSGAITPPNIGDDVLLGTGEDEESRPFTRNELEMKVAKALQRRDQVRRDAAQRTVAEPALFDKTGKPKRK